MGLRIVFIWFCWLLNKFFPIWWGLLCGFNFWSNSFFYFQSLMLFLFKLFNLFLSFFKFDLWNNYLLLFLQLTKFGIDFWMFLVTFLMNPFRLSFFNNLFELLTLFGDESEYVIVLSDLLLMISFDFDILIVLSLKVIELSILCTGLIFPFICIIIAISLELIIWFVIDNIKPQFFSGFLFNQKVVERVGSNHLNFLEANTSLRWIIIINQLCIYFVKKYND